MHRAEDIVVVSHHAKQMLLLSYDDEHWIDTHRTGGIMISPLRISEIIC